MCKIICITNRKLCREDFLSRITSIAKASPDGIILREKDMPPQEYRKLAEQVMHICSSYNVPCILHSFTDIASELDSEAVHLPMHLLRQISENQKNKFSVIGASCHSLKEAKEALHLGCTYITASHIFPTDCKKGLEPRGLDFLNEICRKVPVPVYALGGITEKNAHLAFNAGADGICIMSELMRCEDPGNLMDKIRQIYKKKFTDIKREQL
ncbi:MAG: thiamine phosphate synthase [Porcipelethomonas sp.]